MSIVTQKHHPYTRHLNSETSGDSKTGFYIVEIVLGLCVVSLMFRYMTVRTVVPCDLAWMLRTGRFGKTRLALHVPSSA